MKNQSIITRLVALALTFSFFISFGMIAVGADENEYINAAPANDEQGWGALTPRVDSDSSQIIFESKEVLAGTSIAVDIIFDNMPKIKSMMIDELMYNEDLLDLIGVESKIENPVLEDWDEKRHIAIATFEENTDCNGVVLTLIFDVKPNVGETTQITANGIRVARAVVGEDIAKDDEAIEFEVVAGTINIVGIRRGDVNGDGAVNSDDAIYLLRHTLDPNRYPINQSGDMNGDKLVDSNDAVWLLRHSLNPEKFSIVTNDSEKDSEQGVAFEILDTVWNSYAEEDKFMAAGGFGDNMNWEGVGSIPTDNEEAILVAQEYFVMDETAIAMVEEIAHIMNSMNANTFTAGAFKLKADADKDAFIASVTESVKNHRWFCGSPEKFVVITLGDYIVTAFGHAGVTGYSANTVPTFVNNLKACYPDAAVVVEEFININ